MIGTFASGHITPATDLLDLLNTTAVQTALGDNPMFVPDSLQFTQPGMFNQLETYGMAFCVRWANLRPVTKTMMLERDSYFIV